MEEMVFEIEVYELNYGKREFCLVIGFQFGEFFATLDFRHGIQLRVFPTVKMSESVKLKHVINVFETSLHELSDDDVTRLYLLYLLENGFNDLFRCHPLEEYLSLVSNFDDFKCIISLIYKYHY